MRVYIVCDSDLGWDNVIAVFSKKEDAEACVLDRNGEPDGSTFMMDEEVDDKEYVNGIYQG